MIRKTTTKETVIPEGVEVVNWWEAVTFDISSKEQLLWLYEILKSHNVTQLSTLENLIAKAK